MSLTIFLPIIISFGITAIATSICLPIIKRLGIVDDPKTHKHPAILHTKPIPRGGGIPLFLGIIITSLFFIPLNQTTIALAVAAGIALIVGTLDDTYDISPYFRFATNVLCAAIVVFNGVTFSFITNPLGGILHLNMFTISLNILSFHITIALSDVLALIWIVWVMNMLNWSKGVDGQMPGIVAISAFIIGLLSFRFPLSEQATLIASHVSFIISGAAVGFLLFNFYPAKIFPGYGATSMYLLLAAVSIISSAKLATAVLVMGVPMIDGIVTILRRIFSGKSPFRGDRKHVHHLLLKMGWGQRRIALFYWLVSAIVGTVSLTLSSQGKLFAIIMLAVVIGGGLFFLHITLAKDNEN